MFLFSHVVNEKNCRQPDFSGSTCWAQFSSSVSVRLEVKVTLSLWLLIWKEITVFLFIKVRERDMSCFKCSILYMDECIEFPHSVSIINHPCTTITIIMNFKTLTLISYIGWKIEFSPDALPLHFMPSHQITMNHLIDL